MMFIIREIIAYVAFIIMISIPEINDIANKLYEIEKRARSKKAMNP